MLDKKLKSARIIPMNNARFFEIEYIYEIQESEEKHNNNKALAIDVGINNLCTCVTSDGDSFIIDGKKIKSWNQWYNKEQVFAQKILDKQRLNKKNNKFLFRIALKKTKDK